MVTVTDGINRGLHSQFTLGFEITVHNVTYKTIRN